MTRLVSDTAAIFTREWLRYRRDRAYWIGQIVFPLAFVAFVGFGLDEVVELPGGGRYSGHLAAGVLVLVVGSGAVGGGFSLIEDRDSGFLRALLVAPVSRASIVLGKLAARVLVSLALVLLLVCALATVTPVRVEQPAALLLAVVGVSACFVALGVTLASRLRRLESFRLVAALVTVPLYLFSGIFYPVSTLPAYMQLPAYANPMTYGADLFRFGLLGTAEFPPALSAALLAVLSVVGVLGAIASFARGVRA